VAAENGRFLQKPAVAELGPGDSIGIGLAALLSGAREYYALDVVDYGDAARNMTVFDELVELFRSRAAIPDEREFPKVQPLLTDYSFPDRLLPPPALERSLREDRLQKIRRSIVDPRGPGSLIHPIVPWIDSRAIPPESIDLIFSQAVLEHVTDLPLAYRAMRRWLAPGGLMSHQIDFKCHGKAAEWNGHWSYSDLSWRLIRGKQVYLLNREPHSTHLRLLRQEGFRLVCDRIQHRPSNLPRERLARRFRDVPAEDLTISEALIQAVR